MNKKVTTAVIAAAGLGTRFLPMTKAMPKEMLPIIDKPIIQYVVEEAVAAGVTDIIIVGSANKRTIEDHFDHQYELENQLMQKGKTDIAERMKKVADMANFIYLRQKGTYGNGTPVLNAAHLLNGKPFFVLFADDFFNGPVPRAVALLDAYQKTGKSVIAVTQVERERAKNYGVVDIKSALDDHTFELNTLVEKPAVEQAPTHDGQVYAVTGGFLLTPDIIPLLEAQQPDHTGEIYLTNALKQLMSQDKVFARHIEGRWHDCGNKEKYLEAIVDVALDDPAIAPAFKAYLQDKLGG
ncbi:MAG: UTP-glucose-phosphate uridylyltransferase, UTP--glucose-phosphate uridylyltransferase [Patescibacteria group bacterium]|nr:UTP-glucose-phosphate uridylyltransferase, UTP--glucose-phosphate uridylyltransferase [Patescibacteria group bacterium]